MSTLTRTETPVWTKQCFESDIAGVPFVKLDMDAVKSIDVLADELEHAGVYLALTRLDGGHLNLVPDLVAAGFEKVETLVTFYQPVRRGVTDPEVTLASPADSESCVDLALHAFTYDRLHQDPRVPDGLADEIRAAWVRNNLEGRAAASLVIRKGNEIAGFNLCLKRDRTAIIDLIAIDPDYHRQGLGKRLIEAAFAHFGDTIDGIRVGTQLENSASIKLYQSTGFQEEKRQTTLHWVNDAINWGARP